MKWVALLAVAGLSGFAVTTLPRPSFPRPVASAAAPTHMSIVSSRHNNTFNSGHWSRSVLLPQVFRGAPQQSAIFQSNRMFALYGKDGVSARYLLALDQNDHFLYGFDFKSYVWPPRIRPGEREFVYEEVVWAREADGVLYVENAHSTYASSSYEQNAYITAIALKTKRALWRSPALVANAKDFVVTGRYLVTGYGFTAEPDYLYLLDRRNGRVVERLLLPNAPDRISRHGNELHVRTYDHSLVVALKGV
jgi:hypothetical protein